MNRQTELTIEQQNSTRWQKVLALLGRVDEAMNYDPAVHAVDMVRHLGQEVTRLESRVIELEQHQQENY